LIRFHDAPGARKKDYCSNTFWSNGSKNAADQLMLAATAPVTNFVINLAALPDLKSSSYP
jgi:hypothetical protein